MLAAASVHVNKDAINSDQGDMVAINFHTTNLSSHP